MEMKKLFVSIICPCLQIWDSCQTRIKNSNQRLDALSYYCAKIFDDFIEHVDELNDEPINLTEAGFLLDGVGKIYTAQVLALQEEILQLAAFATRTTKKVKEKKPKKTEKTEGKEGEVGEEPTVSSGEEIINKPAESEESRNEVECPNGDLSQTVSTNNCSTENECSKNTTDEDMIEGDIHIFEGFADSTTCETCDNLLEPNTCLGDNNNSPDHDISLNEGETVTLDLVPEKSPETAGLLEPVTNPGLLADKVFLGLGPVTRKRLLCYKSLLKCPDGINEFPLRRQRFEIVLAPKLISCFDEEMEISKFSDTYAGNDEPPHLEPVPPLPVKIRKVSTKDEFIGADGVEHQKNSFENNSLPTSLPMENAPKIFSGCISTDTHITSEIRFQASLQNLSQLPEFSPEDQVEIQRCINELHYLPFTFDLSKTDLSQAFNKTVDKLCSIFQKYNVPLNRSMIKVASAVCTEIVSKGDTQNGFDPAALILDGLQESSMETSNGVASDKLEKSNSEKTIFERTKEKTVAHSRATIQTMLLEMQRSIVPKYARIPLMEENTPEFFQRVTMFEKKMKKVLAEEETKEVFDVHKYEMEVLEVTSKETLDQDKLEDEVQVPQSPINNTVLVHPDEESNQDLDINFQGSSSSSRSSFEGSQGSNSNKWIPLSHIFNRMKKLEKVEACRLFYAVLALLSYQNLDVNYEHLYSEESAALITKSLDHDKDGKYPIGMKIMTSRCPDIDKEEIYIATLTSKSPTEAFRELLEQNGGLSGDNNTTVGSSVNGPVHEEARDEFVEETGNDYVGNLHGKRRRKDSSNVAFNFLRPP